MTSFAFMFDCVPLPVCQTTSGKCSSRSPASTLPAASAISAASFAIELAEVAVDVRGRHLHDSERADHRAAEAMAADPEVLEAALGLRAPVALLRHLDVAHAVGLDAVAHASGIARRARSSCAAADRGRSCVAHACPPPTLLAEVSLFALLDDQERALLAERVETVEVRRRRRHLQRRRSRRLDVHRHERRGAALGEDQDRRGDVPREPRPR